MLKDFQKSYGKLDGAYWWAVSEYNKESGLKITLGEEPHRIHSEFKGGFVILKNVFGEELGKYQYEKSSKRTTKRKSKRIDSEPEQLENTSS